MIEININKINKSYAFNNVLKDFSFDIKTGERIGLIGNNGTGKTTLFKLITLDETPDNGVITIRKNASIGYLRQIPPLEKDDVLAKDVYLRGIKELLIMKEELDELEKSLTKHERDIKKYTNLRESFKLKGGYELNKKINKIMSIFKLNDNLMNTEYNKLSGGEKTIINLAALILSNPDILLLDEPTNHLDIDTLEWLEEFLSNYKGTVLIISHDRYFLDRVVNKIICINNGKEDIYYGNYSYYLKESEKRELSYFLNYKNQQKEIKALNDAIDRLRQWANLSDNPTLFRRMHAMEKRLENIELIDKPIEKKNLAISFKNNDRSGNSVLLIKNLDLSVSSKQLLNNANMNIYYKDRVCLMGKNGAGKTTLIKNIMDNNNSHIVIGSNVKIGYIPQEIRFSNENDTVFEHMRGIFVGSESELRSKLFQFYFGSETIDKKLKSLSGGEKVRIKLLELILKDINLLILDEPTNHIDVDTKELLENSLLEFEGTILFISHDRYFINKIATKIVRFEDMKLITYDGNYDSVKEKPIYVEEKVNQKSTITINASNRVLVFIKGCVIKEIDVGNCSTKIYMIKKKSKTYFLKVDNHLSAESMRLDYLEGKIKISKKIFYEKYNGKSYIMTESLKGETLCSDYYLNNPLLGIDVVIEAFNSLYNVDYSDCMFDETIDKKLDRIEESIDFETTIKNEKYYNRFLNKKNILKYLRGNKPKSILGFTHGNMKLSNIYANNGSFSGLLNIGECGISDIYYDIVICEISIEKNYGKEYVDIFYDKLGIEKDNDRSEYYRIMMEL